MSERAARPPRAALRALYSRDYRLWAGAALGSNLGTWMQRTAQDWLVLTRLTAHSALALGLVTALQFAPQALLLPLTGPAADRSDRRRLLVVTQGLMGVLALALAALVLTGAVRLWQVYGFALLLGIVAAFDAPARGAFVSDLVPPSDLPNAVALNALSFNMGRLCGPALTGILIGSLGTGPVFLINATSFGLVLCALHVLRRVPVRGRMRPGPAVRAFTEVLGLVARRPDLIAVLWMFGLMGAVGVNLPILVSTMAIRVFQARAVSYGFVASLMAVGAVGGALLAAVRAPRMGILSLATAMCALATMTAALAPGLGVFALALLILGFALQVFVTSANSLLQLSVEPAMRGRLLAFLIAVALGGAPIVAPLFGWVADGFGPRFALAGIAVLAATAWSIGWRAGRAGIAGRSVPLAQAGEDRMPATSVASPAWAPED